MLLMLSNVLLLHLQYHKFCWISCLLSSKFFCLFLLTVKKFCCKSIHKVLYNLFISILGQNVLCRKMWTSFDYFTQQKVYKKVPKKKKKYLRYWYSYDLLLRFKKKKEKKNSNTLFVKHINGIFRTLSNIWNGVLWGNVYC